MSSSSFVVLEKIKQCQAILAEMYVKAVAQKALNIEPMTYVQQGLSELEITIRNGEKIDRLFISKWRRLMGWVPRYFEGHSLVDLLGEIDEFVRAR